MATKESRYVYALALTVTVVTGLFVSSAMFTERRFDSLHEDIATLERTSLRNFESFGRVRAALRRTKWRSALYAGGTIDRAAYEEGLRESRAALDAALVDYLASPAFVDERAQYPEFQRRLGAVDTALGGLLQADAAAPPMLALAAEAVKVAIDAAIDRVEDILELSVRHAVDAATAVERRERVASHLALGLEGLCVAIAFVAVVLGARAVRRSIHLAVEERRAAELELFAQRVAHDLLSPISSLSFALAPLRRTGLTEARANDVAARASSCVQRAQRLVQSLFEFARSGATPDPTAAADVGEVLSGVVEDVLTTDERGLEIRVPSLADVTVQCSAGVLASILGNLLSNAAKHTHATVERRVVVRVAPRADTVRFEVEDNGPGLPLSLAATAFEPYQRASGANVPGLGLGLATVKRLVDAHAGRVGFAQASKGGALFWVELPRARDVVGDPERALGHRAFRSSTSSKSSRPN